MTSEARIIVRAQFNDTLQKFAQLIKALERVEAVAKRTNNALFILSDGMQKNAAAAEEWAAAASAATGEVRAQVAPLALAARGVTAYSAAQRAAIPAAGGFVGGVERAAIAMERWGKKVQWAGSILTYNFTLPIGLAFGLALHQELKFQHSLGQLQTTLYSTSAASGTFASQQARVAHETQVLSKIIILLSNKYGIARQDIADITTELARAGVANKSLVEDTQSTVMIMRAFDLTTQQATDALLQLRITYGDTSKQARQDLGVLAVAAQETRADFATLTAGFVRAGPIAAQLGIDVRHLAAEIAVMNQAGFKGGEAGNALNFALTRLIKPTPEASKLFHALGINIGGAAWQSANADSRFQILANSLKHATNNQIALTDAVVFGARQAPKLATVIDALRHSTSTYNTVLDDTASKQRNLQYLNTALAAVMKRPDVQLHILIENMKNAAREMAIALIPILLGVTHALVGLAQGFANLPHGIQQFIIYGLLVAAVVGPVAKLIGAFTILGSLLMRTGVFFARLAGISAAATAATAAAGEAEVAATGAAVEGIAAETAAGVAATAAAADAAFPPMLAVQAAMAAVLAGAVIFHKQFVAIILSLVEDLGYLAHAIYALFSWMDPTARHSPSLVERVNNGVNAMIRDFSRLSYVKDILVDVKGVMQDLNHAAAKMGGAGVQDASVASSRRTVAKDDKTDLGVFDRGVAQLKRLYAAMDDVAQQWRKQKKVVDEAKAAYDKASNAVDAAEKKLKGLQDRQQKLQDLLKKLGDPTALHSQATALREMARSLALAGNDSLAKRFADQADAMDAQAQKAQNVQDKIDSLSQQIDAQQQAIQDLTAERDKLLASYDKENQKLTDLADGYSTLKARAEALKSALMNLAQASRQAAAAAKSSNKKSGSNSGALAAFADAAKGNVPNLLGSGIKNDMGNLDQLLAKMQRLDALKLGNPFGAVGKFFSQIKDAWTRGWNDWSQHGLRDFMPHTTTILEGVLGFIGLRAAMKFVGSLVGKIPILLKGAFGGIGAALRGIVGAGLPELGTEAAIAATGIGGAATETSALTAALAALGGGPVLVAVATLGSAVALGYEWAKALVRADSAGKHYADTTLHVNALNRPDLWIASRKAIESHTTAIDKGQVSDQRWYQFGMKASAARKQEVIDYSLLDAKIAAYDYTVQSVTRSTGLSTKATQQLATAARIDLTNGAKQATAAFQFLTTNGLGNNVKALRTAYDAYGTFHDQAASVADKVRALQGIFDTLSASIHGATRESDDANQAVNDLGSAIKGKLDPSLKGLTDRAIGNRNAMRDVAAKIQAATLATLKQTDSGDAAARTWNKLTGRLRDAAIQHGLTKAAADRLLRSLGLEPHALDAIITRVPRLERGLAGLGYKFDDIARATKGASDNMRQLLALMMGVAGQAGKAPPLYGPGGVITPGPSKKKKHALGGNYGMGEWMLVGEEGPELVYSGSSAGRVVTAPDTRKMLSDADGGSQQNIEVHLHETTNADPTYIAAHIAFALRNTT